MATSKTIQDKDYYKGRIFGKKEILKKLEDYGLTIDEVSIVFVKEDGSTFKVQDGIETRVFIVFEGNVNNIHLYAREDFLDEICELYCNPQGYGAAKS
jgi:hypothetical protein